MSLQKWMLARRWRVDPCLHRLKNWKSLLRVWVVVVHESDCSSSEALKQPHTFLPSNPIQETPQSQQGEAMLCCLPVSWKVYSLPPHCSKCRSLALEIHKIFPVGKSEVSTIRNSGSIQSAWYAEFYWADVQIDLAYGGPKKDKCSSNCTGP